MCSDKLLRVVRESDQSNPNIFWWLSCRCESFSPSTVDPRLNRRQTRIKKNFNVVGNISFFPHLTNKAPCPVWVLNFASPGGMWEILRVCERIKLVAGRYANQFNPVVSVVSIHKRTIWNVGRPEKTALLFLIFDMGTELRKKEKFPSTTLYL